MIAPGKYSVWFKTPIREAAGVIELGRDGALSGGDTTFSYNGEWTQDGARFRATLSARRVEPGPPGVFGMDAVDVVIAGHCEDDGSVSCAGFARQSPGLKLEVVLIPSRGD